MGRGDGGGEREILLDRAGYSSRLGCGSLGPEKRLPSVFPTYLPVAMSATAHVADLKKIIADATEALKAIQMASAKTEKAAPTPLDASKTTACARASNQLTSTHTTPTAADDDDE